MTIVQPPQISPIARRVLSLLHKHKCNIKAIERLSRSSLSALELSVCFSSAHGDLNASEDLNSKLTRLQRGSTP